AAQRGRVAHRAVDDQPGPAVGASKLGDDVTDQRGVQRAGAVNHQHPARTRLGEHGFQQRVVLKTPHRADRSGEFGAPAGLAELQAAAAHVGPDVGDQARGGRNRHQRRGSGRISSRANRLSGGATASGSGDGPVGTSGSRETGSLALSTVDFACAAASLAASTSCWPLVSIRCCKSTGASAFFGGAGSGALAGAFLAGAFLAGAFLAGAFFAGAFFAGAFLAGAFAAFLAGPFASAAGGTFLAGGVGAPLGSLSG